MESASCTKTSRDSGSPQSLPVKKMNLDQKSMRRLLLHSARDLGRRAKRCLTFALVFMTECIMQASPFRCFPQKSIANTNAHLDITSASQQNHPKHSPIATKLEQHVSMSIPGFDPNTAGNHEEIEMQFAVKTVEHLEVRPFPMLLLLTYPFPPGIPKTPPRAAAVKAETHESRRRAVRRLQGYLSGTREPSGAGKAR